MFNSDSSNVVYNLQKLMASFLNPYLLAALKRNKLFPLNPIQLKSFDAISNKKHIFLNSPTGSGKTLAYLAPIMSRLLDQPRSASDPKEPYGALIMTMTKELCIQIYRQIRLLDHQSRLKVCRTGSISYFSGVIELMNKGVTNRQEQIRLGHLAQDNVVNSVNWSNTDILISTPTTLCNITNSRQLNPKFIVIDEADLLIQLDKNIAQDTKSLLRTFAGVASPRRELNEQRQFFMSCSSFPAKVSQGDSLQGITFSIIRSCQNGLKGQLKHTLPKQLEVKFVRVSDLKDCPKLDILVGILKEHKQKERSIIFVNSTSEANKLKKELEDVGIDSSVFSATLDIQSRTRVLTRFEQNQKGILITTDLGSRGLDFDVPLVIQFGMAKNVVDYINRAGRTARFGKPGTIISFVEESDEQLYGLIEQTLRKGLPFDQVFSRNRSLSKKLKKN